MNSVSSHSSTSFRLLDLCCCGGGASVGYAAAGFVVEGVDLVAQPDYPYRFNLGDALTWPLGGYDVVHVSPPCKRYSSITPEWARDRWPDLVGPIRDRLRAAVLAGEIGGYVIENVVGAPMRDAVQVCGSAFGLGVRRHRLFESSFELAGTGCAHTGDYIGVYGSSSDEGVSAARLAMGIDWLPWSRLVEAIPPSYTEYLGRQLIRHLSPASSVTDAAGVASTHSRAFRNFARGGSVALVDRVSSAPPARFCRECGEPVQVAETGRWRRYCTQACRQAAWRTRQQVAR